jgi:hypothetical protein
LRTVAGNIRFVLSDANTQSEMSRQQMLQLQQQMEHSQQNVQQKMEQQSQPPANDSENSH